jgi:hypothetical protein
LTAPPEEVTVRTGSYAKTNFHQLSDTTLIEAAEAIRRQLIVKRNDGFSITKVERFCDICGKYDQKVRVLHEPINPENTGHVAIRRFPKDDLKLLDLLASEAFVDTRVASHVVA